MQVTLGLSEGGWKGHFKVWQFLPGKCHVSSGAGCHLTFNRSGSGSGFGSNCLMLLRKCWQEPYSLVTAWPRSQGGSLVGPGKMQGASIIQVSYLPSAPGPTGGAREPHLNLPETSRRRG